MFFLGCFWHYGLSQPFADVTENKNHFSNSLSFIAFLSASYFCIELNAHINNNHSYLVIIFFLRFIFLHSWILPKNVRGIKKGKARKLNLSRFIIFHGKSSWRIYWEKVGFMLKCDEADFLHTQKPMLSITCLIVVHIPKLTCSASGVTSCLWIFILAGRL